MRSTDTLEIQHPDGYYVIIDGEDYSTKLFTKKWIDIPTIHDSFEDLVLDLKLDSANFEDEEVSILSSSNALICYHFKFRKEDEEISKERMLIENNKTIKVLTQKVSVLEKELSDQKLITKYLMDMVSGTPGFGPYVKLRGVSDGKINLSYTLDEQFGLYPKKEFPSDAQYVLEEIRYMTTSYNKVSENLMASKIIFDYLHQCKNVKVKVFQYSIKCDLPCINPYGIIMKLLDNGLEELTFTVNLTYGSNVDPTHDYSGRHYEQSNRNFSDVMKLEIKQRCQNLGVKFNLSW